MYVCKFSIRNPIRDYFLGIFRKFQSMFKKFWNRFENLDIVFCKPVTLVKSGLSKHTIHVLDLPTELQNTEASFILLKSDPTTDALPDVLKILGSSKGNICGALNFWYSCRWVDWAAWNATKDIFLIIFRNAHTSSFSNISFKYLWSNLLRSVWLIKWFYSWPHICSTFFSPVVG